MIQAKIKGGWARVVAGKLRSIRFQIYLGGREDTKVWGSECYSR